MELLYHGHSCIQVTNGQTSIIIDPFISPNPAAATKAGDVKVQYVLLTHGHSDHVADAVDIAKRNNATVIATHELATYMSWQGVSAFGMNLGGTYSFDFGKVKLTHAFHSSGFILDDKQQIVYVGMPGGFLITIDGKTLFHAGDTGLFQDMKMIGDRNQIDVAFLPIGDTFTMGPEDALTAAEWLNAKAVVPVHYNTFPVIEQDADAFVQQLQKKGIDGRVMKAGDRWTL